MYTRRKAKNKHRLQKKRFMYNQIFPKLNHDCPQVSLEVIGGVLGKLMVVGLLLFFTTFTTQGQSNLTLSLGAESVLLDQLVVCGAPDEQTVVFTTAGTETSPRTNITATLNLFPGVEFASLNTAATTEGVTLSDGSNPNQPIFSLPTINPTTLSSVNIAFSVKTACGILDTLSTNNLQVFDTWQIGYQLNGQSLSETFDGVEYKDVIATPNLNLDITEPTGPFGIGMEIRRQLTVSNSGLNSYLETFDYQVRQEEGMSYQALLINGTPINFTKEAINNRDTLIRATIAGTFFIGNTKETGQAGNSDVLFDVDEILSIEEVIIISSCGNDGDSNLGTTHMVNWGCDAVICQEETKTTTLPIGRGEALIEYSHDNGLTVDAGYCDNGSLSITVANNGFEFDQDFGAITNISAGVGFAVGAEFLSADQGYQITTLTIGNGMTINAPNGLVALNDNPAFATDPDGVGGLEDVDGDGFFDDLLIGQSFTITATYGIDCSIGNQFDIENDCDNDFRGNFDGKIEYYNACGAKDQTLFDNFYRSSNSGSTREVCTDPDAFNDQDQFTVIYSGERRMSNFNRTCVGNDEVRVSVTIPDGIILSNQTSIQQDTTHYFPTAINNDGESVMTFDASVLNLNNDYQLNFVFETQCAPVGPTSFPVEISYFCPECTCSHIWYCGILEGAVLHAAGAPCAEFVCETGLQTTNFTVERSTFGFTDANFSTPFDPVLANKKVALSCDSVLMKMTNIVGNQTLTDSVGLAINYGNADESDSELTSFLFNFATVTIQSGGNTRTCVLDTSAYTIEILGSNKTMYFDLSSCLNGLSLTMGDQINFEGHFAINPDAPIPSNTFKKIPALRGRGYATIDGQLYDNCDSFGELFRLAKLTANFSGPSNSTNPAGCASANLQYTISKSINANAMREFFGEEHRQAVRMDSIKFTYDPAILTAFEDLSVEYRIQGSQWFPLPNLAELEPGLYKTGFRFLSTASTIAGSNQVFQFRINLTPSCSSQFGSSTNDDLYEIEAKVNYQNRAYANFEGNEACVEIKEIFDKRFFQYQEPPTFSLEAVVGEVQSGESLIQWEIEHCNTSFDSDAGVTFIQLEKSVGDAEVLFIENISFPDAIDTLVLQTSSVDTSTFAFATGLSKRGTNVDPADICNTYRITARMNSCGENNVLAKLGWNCVSYDDTPNWTPDLYAPCEAATLLLKASTLEPLLSASFQEAESTISGVLCDTSTMIILVRNEEEGNAFDIQSQIILPTGATLVPKSIEFSYPSNADFQPIAQDPNFLGDNEAGRIYQYDDFENLSTFLHTNGLPGFSINATDSSEFKIKYRFITNCTYQNGELNRYSFQGITACGTPTNNVFAETNPIIFQADPSVARNFEIEFGSTGVLTSNQSATFQIQVKNIGTNVSSVDKIEVELPEVFTYVANSIQATAPNNWSPAEPTIKNNAGIDVLNLLLPTGLGQDETASFQFAVNVASLVCDSNYTTKIATTSTIDFTCTIDGETCNYDFNSSNEGEFLLNTNCESVGCTINEGTQNLSLLMPDCDSTIYYCFNQYSGADLETYTVMDNGAVVDSTRFAICDFQQVCIYTYAQISTTNGAIRVDSWIVDGVTYNGTVSSITELVDSMNVWDEGGNWVIVPEALIIEGGHVGGDYSRMEITFPTSGIRSFLGYDTRLSPEGISIFLTEGFHQLVVSNVAGCMDTINVDILRQTCPTCTVPIVENIFVENANCKEESGSATINITGNASDYNFIWSPNVGEAGTGENSRINLPTASYLVQIVDKTSNECFETVFVTVGNSDGPTANFTKSDATCGMSNGAVTLTPDTYTYAWNDGVIAANRGDLSEGRYIVTITDIDAPDCTNLITINIEETNQLMVSHTVFKTPTCLNNDGVIALDVSGGSGGYKSSFLDGNLSQLNLASGAYDLVITDTITGCSVPYLLVLDNQIHQGAITILDTTQLVCAGDNNGAINFDIVFQNGFRFPADTFITDGQFTYENGQLPAGNYEIHLRDGNGCLAGNTTFEIKAPKPLAVGVSTTGDCNTNQAINLTVQGGVMPYIFDWADVAGIQNDRDRVDLLAANYEVSITDGNGCLLPLTVNLDSCTCLPATIIDTTFIAADCGQSNGVVSIEIGEPIVDYTFTYEPNLGQEGATKNTRMALPAGDYEVVIAYQGDTTCATTINITIPENGIRSDLITATNILPADCGQSNGVVSIEIAESLANYTFIYQPNLGQEGATKNTRMALPAGDYEVSIALDGDTNCAVTTNITVLENNLTQELVTATDIIAADCGQSNGSITLTIAGDATSFEYQWSGNAGQVGETPNSRMNLSAGTYDVIITTIGNSNCTTVIPFTIPTGEIGESPLIDTLITNASCGQEDGQVAFTFIDNSIRYTYEWTPNLGIDGNVPNTRVNLPAGDYLINIIDPANTDCNYNLNLNIPAAPPSAEATVFASTCETPVTGVVVLSPTTYTYTWPDGFVGNNRNQLAAGTYEVSFTDQNETADCEGSISVVIGIDNILAAEAVINHEPTCEQANGEVTLNVTGGSGDYSYSWASETNSSSDLAAGAYTITVFDATLGCQTTVDFELTAIPVGVATILITDTIDVSCNNGIDGGIQFSVNVSDDFQLPMDTLITDGIDTFENGALPVGDYCLEIKDAFGCLTGEACFTIGESSALMLMYEAFAACADTGGIKLEITGGTSPYIVDWADLMGVDNPVNRTALDTGLYEVMITDDNGCTEMASINVPACEACNLPTITAINTTPSTCTGNTGSIFIQMEEDERDYEFIYMPDLGQPFVTGNIRASLPKGNYRILIVYKPNPTCIMEVEVEVLEKNFDDLLPITSPSECGLATGRVLLLPASNSYTWADGFIGNSRSELPAGFYQIRVRDEEFDCGTTITVVVDEDNLLQAKVAITTPPTCGNADGAVAVSINGGSGDYTYGWQGGMPTRSNLRSGTYSLLVTDNRTGCKTPVVFTLVDAADELGTITIEEMIPASCPLVADGEVLFTTNLTNLPTTALDTVISNGFTTFKNGQLPQGDYCLSIVDTMGCVYGQGCFTIDAPDFITISTTIIPQCDEGGSITVDVEGGTPPFSFDWEDTQGFADQAVRTNLPAGFYSLTVTDDNDCQTVIDTLWVTVCEPCPLVVGRDTIHYNIRDCSGTQDICLDYDFDVRNPYIVTLNGQEIDLFDINACETDTIETYSPETLFGQGRIGAYTITDWPVNDTSFSGNFNSLEELIVQMNTWDPEGNWQFSAEGTLITGGASGSTYGQIDAMVDGTPITSFLSHETNIIKRGISTELAVGVHEIMVQDPITFCEDTLVIAIACTQTDTINVVTIPSQIDTFCLSTMELPGALDTVIIGCLGTGQVTASIVEETCAVIEGVSVGQDTLCVILCDEFGICDTTVFTTEVHYDRLEDTIDVQTTSTFCLDTLGFSLEGNIVSMTEVCQDGDGLAAYEFDVANFCLTYTGNTLGEEMTCIEVCDDLGFCDTLDFFLAIKNNPPDLVVDTIFVGQTIFYCFDSIIFPEEITFFENECKEDSGEKVDFFLDPITYCVEIRGIDIGRETACIVVCDEDNNCDTAFFEIEVIEFGELPIANDDRDTTDKGVPIILNVKENDIPFGVGEGGLNILVDGMFGDAIVNLDGSVTYFGDQYCEREDEFTYTLCNSNGCDTATVTIYLACVDIVIFTAVSPNRDGRNDVFYISGIEEFPQSELRIYNRWGNLVYQVINYQNDWTGTWKNNQELPDGTYFYQLELKEPNDNRMFEGFLELHR